MKSTLLKPSLWVLGISTLLTLPISACTDEAATVEENAAQVRIEQSPTPHATDTRDSGSVVPNFCGQDVIFQWVLQTESNGQLQRAREESLKRALAHYEAQRGGQPGVPALTESRINPLNTTEEPSIESPE